MDGKRSEDTRIKRKKISCGNVTGIVTLAAFILILCSSDVAIEYMKKGLRLCATTVIPSLFPFMIISDLIVSSGIGTRISRIISRPMRWMFGISEAGASAYFLGTVCGFPIGAKTAVSMYDRGIISKRELERLLTFCNNPGSAFVISATGVSLLGNEKVGILLYVCIILSSVTVGIIGKLFFKKCDSKDEIIFATNDASITRSITNAIQSSAISMLTVCAYVVFFSAFVGCIGALLSRFSISDKLIATIFGFFELSSGVGAASSIENRMGAIVLCALFLGWSGISVHFQIMSVCSGRDISFRPYIISKAAQGIICALLSFISLKFFFPTLLTRDFVTYASNESFAIRSGSIICIAFLCSSAICVAAGIHNGKKVKNKSEKNEKRY